MISNESNVIGRYKPFSENPYSRRQFKALSIKIADTPAKVNSVDAAFAVIYLAEFLSEALKEPVALIPVYQNDLTEEQIELERLMYVDYLKTLPHVLNVGYDSQAKRFLLAEDQSGWEAWIERAKRQGKIP